MKQSAHYWEVCEYSEDGNKELFIGNKFGAIRLYSKLVKNNPNRNFGCNEWGPIAYNTLKTALFSFSYPVVDIVGYFDLNSDCSEGVNKND